MLFGQLGTQFHLEVIGNSVGLYSSIVANSVSPNQVCDMSYFRVIFLTSTCLPHV